MQLFAALDVQGLHFCEAESPELMDVDCPSAIKGG